MKVRSRLIARHDLPGEYNSRKGCKTCSIGYVPVGKQVNMMLNAGLQLNQQRGSYDFADGIDDGSDFDPTLNEDFDLSDAALLLERVERAASSSCKRETNERDAASDVGDNPPAV